VDPWPKRIDAITLFVEDLGATRQFYLDVFGLPIHFENADSAVFKFGETVINLLRVTNADELISPAVVAPPDAGSRMVFTIGVDDVDAMCEVLAARRGAAQRSDGPTVGDPNRQLCRPSRLHLGDREVGLGRRQP